MPKVSVIIPTYNGKKYICEAIDSVLAQTYKDFEIVIIDDGSIDNTKEVINRYKRKIKYIYQKNMGIASARNRGIEAAMGEFIAFLDHDDIADQNWLFKILSGFSSKEVCASIAKAIPLNPTSLMQKISAMNFESIDDSVKHPFYFASTGTIFRKNCFEYIGRFDEKFKRGGEDLDLAHRISALNFKIEYVPQAIIFYRHRFDFISLLRQKFYYGYGKVLVLAKHNLLHSTIVQDALNFLARILFLFVRTFARVVKFLCISKHRKPEYIFEHPIEIICSIFGYMGRLKCRLKNRL